MAEGNWRTWADKFVYRRPYEDAWGTLHDPTSEWDELLKYYQHWVRLIVSEAARRLARPAVAGALELIRQEQRHRNNVARASKLEAGHLEWANRRKQWKRRKKRSRAKARHSKGQDAAQVRQSEA